MSEGGSIIIDGELKETFGDYLRRNREASGKTLDGISRTTRIAKRYLQALEENDSRNLPETAFARGFLKAYAKEVGLDIDDCVAKYDQFQRANMPTMIKEIRRPAKTSFTDGFEPIQNQVLFLKVLGVLVILAATIVGIAYLIQNVSHQSETEKAETIEPPENSENTAEAPPAEAEALVAEVKPLAPHPGAKESTKPVETVANIPTPVQPSILSIKAVKDAKLSIRLDENSVQEVTLKAGESQTVNVFKNVEIRTVDRTGLAFLYNGKPLDISGPVIKLFNRHLFSKKQ